MKIRTGFVSNSSSSSFIVAFPRMPSSVGDVHNMLFGPDPIAIRAYDDPISSLSAASRVWDDIQAQMEQPPIAIHELAHGFEDDVYWEVTKDLPRPWDPDIPQEERMRREAERNALVAAAAEENAKAFMAEVPKGSTWLMFEYEDNSGHFEAVMEHGDIFARLPHKKINNH